MSAQTEGETVAQRIERVAAELGLKITSVFVPFSKSRNAKEKFPTLNWRVTLQRNEHDVLTTDYMAGCGNCPSYKQGARWTLDYDAMIRGECETGHVFKQYSRGRKIEPEPASVIASLVTDSDVLDYGEFEDWAASFGYKPDSRSAERTYRACLDIALKLRNAVGEAGLAKLREACQDY